jgi:aspartate-semialdehyde dehydrogenase
MKPGKEGFRVAVVGSASLLGKELMAILEQGKFPVSRLVTFDADNAEPELPIIDLTASSTAVVEDLQLNDEDLDFTFLAARVNDPPAHLKAWRQRGSGSSTVIDLVGDWLESVNDARVSIPFLDHRFPVVSHGASASRGYLAPHAAVIAISALLLRLAARFPIKTVVAQVFFSASEFTSRGVEELQRQTTNILSFQNPPEEIFGSQLAFNVLPRLGKSGTGNMGPLEDRLHRQLNNYLGGRVPVPALKLVTVPAFYSTAVSLYVETAEPVAPEAATAALAGDRIKIRKADLDAPTPVEVTGSGDILVDRISRDATHPHGLWFWVVADNLHLTASNAVEIAASLKEQARA